MRNALVLAVMTILAITGTGSTALAADTAHETHHVAMSTRRGHVILYGPNAYKHVILSSRTARRYLHGASKSFERYAARTGARIHHRDRAEFGNPPCAKYDGLEVTKYHTRGFAIGYVSACDGAEAVWARVKGRWREIVETQDDIYCSTLIRYGVPSSLFGADATCYSRTKKQDVSYHHA